MQVKVINEAEWWAFVNDCPTATFFHTPNWYKVWKEYADYDYEARLLIFENGKKVLLPLAWRKRLKGMIKEYISAPVGTYGGFLGNGKLNREETNQLQSYIGRFTFLRIRANPLKEILDPSFYTIKKFTQIIDLNKGLEEIKKKWSKNHLRSLKKGIDNEMSIRESNKKLDWKNYYDVYQDSLRRWEKNSSNQYRWSLFDLLSRLAKDNCKLWLIEKEDKLISGCICFYQNEHVVYWHGASLESFFYLRPVHVLHHHIMQMAIKCGFRWYDFNPSGGHLGVVKFKQGFGSKIIPANVYSRKSFFLEKIFQFSSKIKNKTLIN